MEALPVGLRSCAFINEVAPSSTRLRLGTNLGTDLSTDQGTDQGTDLSTDLSTDQGTDLGTDLGTDFAVFDIFMFFKPQKPEGIHLRK